VWSAPDTLFGSKCACRRATKHSTAWQTATARLLVMATNNSAVFTILFRSVGQWQKCNTRQTSQKIWGGCTECTGQREWLWIDYTGKMETRHPVDVEGSFGSEFPAICNHCGIMAAGSLQTPKQAVKWIHCLVEGWSLAWFRITIFWPGLLHAHAKKGCVGNGQLRQAKPTSK